MAGVNTDEYQHIPVLLDETLQGLNLRSNGIYVDCTFGRGGHSQAILNKLDSNSHLFAFDKDPEAAKAARNFSDPRFTFVDGSFTQLGEVMKTMKLEKQVNGILFDLGVSSPQLDNASRGFSFLRDGELDMRMDNSTGLTAMEWLNQATQDEIANVVYEFGDERFSRRIARAIVRERSKMAITRTVQLASLIALVLPGRQQGKHPATKTFQAIRIFINQEMRELQAVLQQTIQVLAEHGRLLVISFHSLEDRLVKHFMREQSQGPVVPREIPVQHDMFKPKLVIISKPIRCQPDEIHDNARARSAVLRIAECLVT